MKKTFMPLLVVALTVGTIALASLNSFDNIRAENSDLRTITLWSGVNQVDVSPGYHYISNDNGVDNIEYFVSRSDDVSTSSTINACGIGNDGVHLVSFLLEIYVHGVVSVLSDFSLEYEAHYGVKANDTAGKFICGSESNYLEIDGKDTGSIDIYVTLNDFSGCSIKSVVITYSESACRRILSSV